MRKPQGIGPWGWTAAATCLWVATLVRASAAVGGPGIPEPAAENFAQAAQTTAPPPATQTGRKLPAPPPQTAGATYVGDADCATCHDKQHAGYVNTAHNRKIDPRTPAAANSCETCHGPASKHIEDPNVNKLRNFSKAAPAEINATCATCHNRAEHALWDNSQHENRNLSCNTCHSVHASKSVTGQLKGKVAMDVCASCHRDKVAKVDRSGHMPLREGKMDCSTCHNPHGATNVKLLRKGDSVAELCTSCHTDKRGPFLWEHAPSRDGCTTCHDPHGSSNERMLVSKPPIFCQRCHVATRHPSTIYDAALIGTGSAPSARIMARSCVTCHSAIHGSNHPSGQRFIR